MEIQRWRGLRNTTTPERFRDGELDIARNVDIDDDGKLFTRGGYSLAQAGAYHSLWSQGDTAFIADATALYRVNDDLTLTKVADLASSRPISYARTAGMVALSNGTDSLIVQNGQSWPWGVEPPPALQLQALTYGDLAPGTYQVSMVYLRSDGQESGAAEHTSITLAERGGIRVLNTKASTHPLVTRKILYLSTTDGETLYRSAVLANADESTFDLLSPAAGVQLRTAFMSPCPGGGVVAFYKARAYVAQGSVVWVSRPYEYELFSMGEDFLQFPAEVTLFAPVDDGVFVSFGNETVFLAGDLGSFEYRRVADYGAIPGSDVPVQAEQIGGGDGAGSAVLWTSTHGVCAGMNGGAMRNLTERTYSFPSAQRGAGLVRQVGGYTSYLASLQGDGVANNARS